MPRLLGLFSSIGSIGKAFRGHGWEVVSVDNDPRAEATVMADILEWENTALSGGFDCVWASPPC